MIGKEQDLSSIAIQKFLARCLYFEDFCWYLSKKLRSAYAYSNLPQHNRSAASIALLEIADTNKETNDLVYQLFLFWEREEYSLDALREAGLIEILVTYLDQLEERHQHTKAQEIRHLLEHLNIEINPAHYCVEIVLPENIQVGKAFKIQICFYRQVIDSGQCSPLIKDHSSRTVITKALDLHFEPTEHGDREAYLQIKTSADDVCIPESSSELGVFLRPAQIVSFVLSAWPLAPGKKQLCFELYQGQHCIASTSHAIQVPIATQQQQQRASLLNLLMKSLSANGPEDADAALTRTSTELQPLIDSALIALTPLSAISEPLQDSTLKKVLKSTAALIKGKKNLLTTSVQNGETVYLASTRSSASDEGIYDEHSQAVTSPAYLDLFQQSLQEIQRVLLPELCAVTQLAVASSYEVQIAAITDSLQQAVLEQDDFAWIKAIQKLQVLKDRLLTVIAREKLQRRIQ